MQWIYTVPNYAELNKLVCIQATNNSWNMC